MIKENGKYWNRIYSTKRADERSWTQEVPVVSLELIHRHNLPKTAKIIDVGGGDSTLVDHLLHEGYYNITVLDVSGEGLAAARKRLGRKAESVNWIISDITDFQTDEKFDLWHDRAVFHFLTSDSLVKKYRDIALKTVAGYMILGTFSDSGPVQCSGLPVRNYSEDKMEKMFSAGFRKIECITQDHITPFHTVQNFIFCVFNKVRL